MGFRVWALAAIHFRVSGLGFRICGSVCGWLIHGFVFAGLNVVSQVPVRIFFRSVYAGSVVASGCGARIRGDTSRTRCARGLV